MKKDKFFRELDDFLLINSENSLNDEIVARFIHKRITLNEDLKLSSKKSLKSKILSYLINGRRLKINKDIINKILVDLDVSI